MEIDPQALPIPEWNLACPQCNYPLCGLPEHRCPECGQIIDVSALVRPWTRVRPPWYTGEERPLADFGLQCGSCGAALAGAEGTQCPHCGESFDVTALLPHRKWFLLDRELAGDVPVAGLQVVLANEHVPHVPVDEKTASEIWSGPSLTTQRLRVPTEFFFDVLYLIERVRREMETIRATNPSDWNCSACREDNPGNFDVCWNCGALPGGAQAPGSADRQD